MLYRFQKLSKLEYWCNAYIMFMWIIIITKRTIMKKERGES